MLWPAIVKDTHLLLRDRGALASLFLLPIIFVVVFGSMFGPSSDRDKARVLPVHYQGETGAAIARAIDESGAFQTRLESSPERVRTLVADDDEKVGLIIPATGLPAELVIDEAASARFRGPIEGALRGILVRYQLGPRVTAPPGEVLIARSPPGLAEPLRDIDGFQVSVPGNAVFFGFFLALTVALSFVEERKTGTWGRLLAAPVSKPLLLIAKLVPWVLVGVVQMAFLFGVGAGLFGMRVGGSLPALCALTLAVVICAVALGLFIASFGGTEKQVGSIGSICLLVLGLLGGAMIPRLTMPETMQEIGLATPHAWALEGYYDLLIRTGTGFADVAVPIAAVLGFALVFATIGAFRFKWN
jgi:ABC-2 type transport system permease protein